MRFPRTLLLPLLLLAVVATAAVTPAVSTRPAPKPAAVTRTGALTPRAQRWAKVREAVTKGLPKTALAELPAVQASAERDRAWAEATRAAVLRIALEARIQGNKPEEKITRLQAELGRAPARMRPMLEAVLAEWMWQYFQQNRWRFMQRSATTTAPSDDFTTWDLTRIYSEIDRHFANALADTASLRASKIAEWDDLLAGGNSPDAYRPTLWDFVAFEALRFWQSGEQAGARPADAFVMRADGPALAPAEEFLRWTPATNDTAAAAYRAVRLYQALIAWHGARGDTAARVDADLWRIDFARNVAVGGEARARAEKRYEELAERFARHEISARALHAWASLEHEAGDDVAAHAIATRGLARFPGSIGSDRCFNLLREIEAHEMQVSAESPWNGPRPEIEVRYRNLDAVHFRLVAWDFRAMAKRRQGPFTIDDADLDRLRAAKPVRAWEQPLAPTPDWKAKRVTMAAPAGVAPGCYVLLWSARPSFGNDDNQVGAGVLWVSDLALTTRGAAGAIEGLVLDAQSGEPVPGATVAFWAPNGNDVPTEHGRVTTDAQGHYRWASAPVWRTFALVTAGTRMLAVPMEVSAQQAREYRTYAHTLFFTDRGLYRPGQPIRFKGICASVDETNDQYHTLAGQRVVVALRDANGQEVARREVRSNDYGSFAGEFEAPRDRLLGAMSLMAVEGPSGMGTLRVEEYKRPKFVVEMEAPRTPARLDSTVTVTGRALAYTGAAVDGAIVRWHVTRNVFLPAWWSWRWWWRPAPTGGPQEIAHGESRTDADGHFAVSFLATPDSSVNAADEASFGFAISADVTDPSGETRSASQSVVVGWTTLAADLSCAEWQESGKPVEIAVSTHTLDGRPQAARGRVTIERLRGPERVTRAETPDRIGRWRDGETALRAPDARTDDPRSWPIEQVAAARDVATDSTGRSVVPVPLAAGWYRVSLETRDPAGHRVTAVRTVEVLDLAANRYATRLPDVFRTRETVVEPGHEFVALWASGYDRARAFVEVVHRGKVVQSWWTAPGATQAVIRVPVTPEMRGGFSVNVTMVRENRAYTHHTAVMVPWSDRVLDVRWERFVSNLHPGQHETWTAVITGPDALRHVAEMAATLYDASLDAFAPLSWPSSFPGFRTEWEWSEVRTSASSVSLDWRSGSWRQEYRADGLSYREFPYGLLYGQYDEWLVPQSLAERRARPPVTRYRRAEVPGREGGRAYPAAAPMASSGVLAMQEKSIAGNAVRAKEADASDGRADRVERLSVPVGSLATIAPPPPPPAPNLDAVAARHDLRETAFFFPQLVANEKGEVRIEFTMPEGVTRWRFLGFAHDRDLRAGLLGGQAVTTRELMVQPNPPRFLREGDVLEFTVKVTNLTDAPQSGRVRLTFADAITGAPQDVALENTRPEQAFDVPARQSRTFAWTLHVPDDQGPLTYKAVAASAKWSDGEDGVLPVLSRSILVSEALPLPIRGAGTKTFDFERLERSGPGSRVRSKSLTVQMVSNPAWYAVMALPYLMEYPFECSEQTFNRLYADQLARHIADSDPRIRAVFDQWKGTKTLDSPLEQNPDLKSVTLLATPWVRQGQSEAQARRNVGLLFDRDRLERESASATTKLLAMQRADGMWPWFPGGPANEYLTLYITTGFGRLRHLGVDVAMDAPKRSLQGLDAWSDQMYRAILRRGNPEANHLSPLVALYLYGRSFYLADQPIAAPYTAARDYWLGQAKRYWLQLDSRQAQGQLAVALQRFGDRKTALAILASVREHAVTNDEMGMFWRDEEHSWWWYRAPIETQAMLIEAFDEVAHDSAAVAECRIWLLKQKQTQDWKTTKATADAVYALLLRGTDLLASDAVVEVALGDSLVRHDAAEAGTGFWEARYAGPRVRPAMGHVTVTKRDPGVAWGSVHWQYLADLADVTPYTGTPLTLRKTLWVRVPSATGPKLQPMNGPVTVGDEIVVRLELRTDRDMEYVHLEDGRGSGTEPVNVISSYRQQDGLWYYEETRDTGSHFFVDYLPKGTYVFEYSVRAQHRGTYPSGIASIQCLYAPEFGSHSESLPITCR